jgi:hypothetical protein
MTSRSVQIWVGRVRIIRAGGSYTDSSSFRIDEGRSKSKSKRLGLLSRHDEHERHRVSGRDIHVKIVACDKYPSIDRRTKDGVLSSNEYRSDAQI